VSRVLAFALIAVLLHAMVPFAICMAVPIQKPGTSAENSKTNPDDADGDAGCCSYCCCCHFAGVLNSPELGHFLVTKGLLAPNRNPLPPHRSTIPFDRPPRF
jgi:hypothetical protein